MNDLGYGGTKRKVEAMTHKLTEADFEGKTLDEMYKDPKIREWAINAAIQEELNLQETGKTLHLLREAEKNNDAQEVARLQQRLDELEDAFHQL